MKQSRLSKIVSEATVQKIMDANHAGVDQKLAKMIADMSESMAMQSIAYIHQFLGPRSVHPFTPTEAHRIVGKAMIAFAEAVDAVRARPDWKELEDENLQMLHESIAESMVGIDSILGLPKIDPTGPLQ
jgi:hypothetical protein